MLNDVKLQGRFTKDPELRQTQNGTFVVAFTLAVERDYSKDGKRETDFINCVAWRGTAGFIAKYFTKGDMAIVVGAVQTRSYTDKNGNKREATEVMVDRAYFCGERRKAATQEQQFVELDDDVDLPF